MPAQKAAPRQSIFGVLLIILVAATLASAWAALPVGVVCWALLLIVSFMEPSPTMTGPKGKDGVPEPNGAREERAKARFPVLKDMRTRLFGVHTGPRKKPGKDGRAPRTVTETTVIDAGWLPFKGAGASWLLGLGVSLVVAALPVRQPLWAPVSAVCAALIVWATAASRRDNLAPDHPNPGVPLTMLGAAVTGLRRVAAVALAGAAGAGAALAYATADLPRLMPVFVDSTYFSLEQQATTISYAPIALGAGVAIMVFLGVCWVPWSTTALAQWRETLAAEQDWIDKFERCGDGVWKTGFPKVEKSESCGEMTLAQLVPPKGMAPDTLATTLTKNAVVMLGADTKAAFIVSGDMVEAFCCPPGNQVDFTDPDAPEDLVKAALEMMLNAAVADMVGTTVRVQAMRRIDDAACDDDDPGQPQEPDSAEPSKPARPRITVPDRQSLWESFKTGGLTPQAAERAQREAEEAAEREAAWIQKQEAKKARKAERAARRAAKRGLTNDTDDVETDEIVSAQQEPDHGFLLDDEDDEDQRGQMPDEQPRGRAAWMVKVSGPSLSTLRARDVRSAMSEALGCEVLVESYPDKREGKGTDLLRGSVLLGDLDGISDPNVQEGLTDIRLRDEWDFNFETAYKMGERALVLQFPTYQVQKYGDVEVERCGFKTLKGAPISAYIGREDVLASAMAGVPFLTVTGWSAGAPGSRHSAAVGITWSRRPVPSSPDALVPRSGNAVMGDGPTNNTVEQWILAGHINHAFQGAKLPQPELVKVRCLTSRRSMGHLWAMTVRLYDGVSIGTLMSPATLERVRAAMKTPFLRFAPGGTDDPSLVVMVAGADPRSQGLVLADRRRDEVFITDMTWQGAFAAAKLVSDQGVAPHVLSISTLPENERVSDAVVSIPPGKSLSDLRAEVKRLGAHPSIACVYVEFRPIKDQADKARMLFSETDPLPASVSYDFSAPFPKRGFPFATERSGATQYFDLHGIGGALLTGLSGSGKSALSANLEFGLLCSGVDVVAIDPRNGGGDFEWGRAQCKGFAITYPQAEAAARWIDAEMDRRNALKQQYPGCTNVMDLPEEVRPRRLVMLVDELGGILQDMKAKIANKPASTPEAEEERQKAIAEREAAYQIVKTIDTIIREGRKFGMHVLVMTQKLRADDLDGFKGLKDNAARLLLGNASAGDRASGLRNPGNCPKTANSPDDEVPKGRGVWEPVDTPAVLIQCWYASTDTYREYAAERVLVHPEPLDLDAMAAEIAASKAPPPKVEGAEIEVDDFGFGGVEIADPDDEPQVVQSSLSEDELAMLDFDLDDLVDDDVQPADSDNEPQPVEWDAADEAIAALGEQAGTSEPEPDFDAFFAASVDSDPDDESLDLDAWAETDDFADADDDPAAGVGPDTVAEQAQPEPGPNADDKEDDGDEPFDFDPPMPARRPVPKTMPAPVRSAPRRVTPRPSPTTATVDDFSEPIGRADLAMKRLLDLEF